MTIKSKINTIEVLSKELFSDKEEHVHSEIEQSLQNIGIDNPKVSSSQIYYLNGSINKNELENVSNLVHHNITQQALINESVDPQKIWDFVIKIDYKPGVTDNSARVLKRNLDLIGIKEVDVFTSTVHYIEGSYDDSLKTELERVASNPLIHDISILSKDEFEENKGFDEKIPLVELVDRPNIYYLNLKDMDSTELCTTGLEGTLDTNHKRNPTQERSGPLALAEDYMNAIQTYSFSEKNTKGRSGKKNIGKKIKRKLKNKWKGKLTNLELEIFAQMWSEHCRHSYFNAMIPEDATEITEKNRKKRNIFEQYIRKPTLKVLEDKPYLGLSIYKDNSGVFKFNDKWNVLIKNETHISPSALDPFGGAITGLVGVGRDAIGTGLGGDPISHFLFYFLRHKDNKDKFFKDADCSLENLLLNPQQIFDGVTAGVKAGGNESGIPTPHGMCNYHNRNFKPIVGVGVVGRMPPEINGKPSYEKHIDVGDKLYIVGGRAGVDGIHGATFSSDSDGLSKRSPATAVQIGDAFTQKKMTEAILELRDKGYIKFITDLGAGGVCCASLEMADEVGGDTCSGGLDIDLDKLLVKYPGMTATELFMNESQERMAIAIDDKYKNEIEAIFKKHEVEFSDIGQFTDTGRAEVYANDEKVADLDLDFVNNGYPQRELKFEEYRIDNKQQIELQKGIDSFLTEFQSNFSKEDLATKEFYEMFKRPNFQSIAPFMDTMDSTVKGLSVQHCIQGKGRVTTKTSCTLVDTDSKEGLIQSFGHTERQSYIDSEKMGKNSFLRSIGNNIALGGKLDYMVATDQTIWQKSDNPKYQQMLKETFDGMSQVVEGCKIPVISGKDTMFNQVKIYNESGDIVETGVFPTLLMTSLAKIDDVANITTIDAKKEGDLVYVVGSTTKKDMGGSEYYNWISESKDTEFNIGQVSNENIADVFKTFEKMNESCYNGLINSANYIEAGGLITAIKETAMAGERGIEFDLDKVHQEEGLELNELGYGETEGRFLVTINKKNKKEFEKLFDGIYSEIGVVKRENITMNYKNKELLSEKVTNLLGVYHNIAAQKGAA